MNEPKIDNRMQWILKLEEPEQAEGNPVYFTEYEICSEVRITGVFTYGNGMFECSLYQEADDNNLYTYILKIKHVEKVFEYDESNYSTDGYYFREGLVGEIIALFSFHFQARFYLKATITGAMTPYSIRMRMEHKFLYKNIKDDLTCLNLEMFSSQNRNWCKDNNLTNFLDSIRAVDQQYHQSLIRAIHWYSVAIKEMGVDHELFFIKMVSSIEALLDISKMEPDDIEKKMVGLKDSFTPDEWIQVERWLQNRKIRKRFAYFLEKHSDGFSGEVPERASHCFIAKDKVVTYAKRIYDARSAYLHTGKPMFLSMDMRGDDSKKWDLDPSMGMSIDRKKISEKEKLPRTRWFERIVNYSIHSFIMDILPSK
ncbi:MAG: HEPN domain-containing protein [bacterium]|nr:HEPN domain-containing protein [bacterium]